MNINDRLLDLTQQALEELDNPNCRVSSVIRKAIRLANLRNDYYNVLWLRYETISVRDDEAKLRLAEEVAPHYTKQEFALMKKRMIESFIEERGLLEIVDEGKDGISLVDNHQVCSVPVAEIEEQIERFSRLAASASPPDGLHPVDLYFTEQAYSKTRVMYEEIIGQYKGVLARVGSRVHEFLSATEKQLIYGQIHSDIFERNREYVDARLNAISPEALEQFIAVYRRLGEGDSEAKSQALGSFRRILKSLADSLYPPREDPVIGTDGKPRILTDEKYIARLWQYVSDQVGTSKTGNLMLAQIDDLGSRIDRVYGLTNKGVHTEVSDFEVNQCVIQTYLLAGDLLRITDEESAVFC